MVLALNESIWFAAEGFFIDSEHYTIEWRDLQSINENIKAQFCSWTGEQNNE